MSRLKFISSVAALLFLFSCRGDSNESDSDLNTIIYMAEAVQEFKNPGIGNIVLKGTVSLKNRQGRMKTLNREKTIEVIQ